MNGLEIIRSRLKHLNVFESATLRLTAWYVLLLMALSLLFSTMLFTVASHEFSRALGPNQPGDYRLFLDSDVASELRGQRVADSNARLVGSLAFFNIAVLMGGSALAYLLARQTLKPVEAAHEAQSRFASDAAHELRTPLSVMQTEIEVGLRDKKATKQDYEATLRSALDEVGRLRTLTDRLLLLASQQQVELGPVDIEDASVESITHAIPLAQTKHVAIDNQVASVMALANRESVVNILDILIDNAIKYAPAKTTITLQSKLGDTYVEVAVSDEGEGIASEEHDKIFERFYRSDLSRSKDNVEGHGLGLSLAKVLVEEMDGSIRVVSEPGAGAHFIVRLPRNEQAKKPTAS